jgi:hypothetical protein
MKSERILVASFLALIGVYALAFVLLVVLIISEIASVFIN